MSVKIRLMKVGRKKVDQYRIVVADIRFPRDGRSLETIGYYQPQNEPSVVKIKEDRALYWLSQGVLPTQKVKSLLRKEGILAKFRESTAVQEG